MDGFHGCGYGFRIRLGPAKISRKALKELVNSSARHEPFRFVIRRGSRILVVFGHTDLIGVL